MGDINAQFCYRGRNIESIDGFEPKFKCAMLSEL